MEYRTEVGFVARHNRIPCIPPMKRTRTMSKALRFACAALVLLGFVATASSQTATPLPTAPGASTASAAGTSSAAMDAEREKIWNSPTMLRARAWVQEYCAASAKITPEEAKQYMTELENLSPAQMKLWLLKFDHEEQMIRQQQAAFNIQRQAGLQTAGAYRQATQQELAAVNRDENEAAQEAQQSINTEQEQAFQRGLQTTADRDAANAAFNSPGPWGPYGAGYGYGFVPGYGGGVHIHVHPQ
jgi:hypothetical protein